MAENLLVVVMGHRNSGKSTTWNELFERTVRTGKELRQLDIGNWESVEVFLVSGSPEERHEYVGDLLSDLTPRIVLCSLQYREGVGESFSFFFERNYQAVVHWLNPGFNDGDLPYADNLGLVPQLLAQRTLIGVRNGRLNTRSRVRELRDVIAGWARPRHLIRSEV